GARSAGQLCFFATRSRFVPIVPRARSTSSGFTSTSSTSNPEVANACAIPFPIVPPPTTAILRTAAEGPGLCDSVIVVSRASDTLDRHRHRVAAAETQGRETGLLAARLQRVDQRHQHAGSGGADWMPERDRAA